jgi:hypothetical protein
MVHLVSSQIFYFLSQYSKTVSKGDFGVHKHAIGTHTHKSMLAEKNKISPGNIYEPK